MNTLFSNKELLDSAVLFLQLGSIVGIVIGAMMLWRPTWLTQLGKRADSWVSTRQMARSVQQYWHVDQWFYRYGRLWGGILSLGSIYIIYGFTARVTRSALLESLMSLNLLQPNLLEPILDTMVFVFLAGAILGLLISVFLIFRPSMLREMEIGANQRFTLRQALKPLEVQHFNLDSFIFSHRKITGGLLLISNLYIFIMLTLWLLA